MAGLLNDDWRLHKLCQEGVLSSVVEYGKGLNKGDLEKKLARHGTVQKVCYTIVYIYAYI